MVCPCFPRWKTRWLSEKSPGHEMAKRLPFNKYSKAAVAVRPHNADTIIVKVLMNVNGGG